MKFLLFIGLLCGTVLSATAQTASTGVKFSIGADLTVPLGKYSDLYGAGYGGSAKIDVPLNHDAFLTASAGYLKLSYSSGIKAAARFSNETLSSAPSYIPLRGGLKYYVGEEYGFFLEGQIGAVIATGKGSGTAFAYAPGLGYTFAEGIEGSARYEGWVKNGTLSQVALRLAYRF